MASAANVGIQNNLQRTLHILYNLGLDLDYSERYINNFEEGMGLS